MVHKFLTKQIALNKAMKLTQRLVLKRTHLPMTIKEMLGGYFIKLYYKNRYVYLAQNQLLSSKAALSKVETEAEKYLLLDSFLFGIQTYHNTQNPVPCITESCVNDILDLLYNSLLEVHLGSLRTFLTIKQKCYLPFNALH